MIIPLIFSEIINYATNGSFSFAYRLIFLLLCVVLFYYISESWNQYTYYKLYNKIHTSFTNIATEATFHNSTFSLSRFSLGEYVNILNNDIDVISTYYSDLVLRIVQLAEFLIIYVYFYFISFYIFLLTIVFSLVMIFCLIKTGDKTQEYNQKRKASLDKKTAIFHEMFFGIKEIKGYNVFQHIERKVNNSSLEYLNDNQQYNIQYKNAKYICLTVIEVIRILIIFYAVYLVSNGNMAIGSVVLLYNYYQKIIDNFSIVSTLNVEIRNCQVSSRRFEKLIEYISTPYVHNLKPSDWIGKICFSDVLYGYRHDPTLNMASFEILPNQITVITGKAGVGKTGILDLLLRFNRQHEGDITIDGISIQDICDKDYSTLVAAARRDPFFFDVSIRENLKMIDSNFENIVNVCKMLQLHDDIVSFPDGYDTILGECGHITSTHLQLLAIARLLLRNPKIMLIGEMFNSLDRANQLVVMNLLKKMKESHTIVIVSREREILEYADRVIVVENNAIVEMGTRKELLHQKGFYYQMFGKSIDD